MTQEHTLNKPQILRIALDVPLDRFFDYIDNGEKVQFGSRVIVPFSGRKLVGVVVELPEESEYPLSKLKQVEHVFEGSVLNQSTFKLLKFCASYYHYPLGQILISTLPLRLRQLKPAVTRKRYVYALVEPVPEGLVSKRQVVLQRVINALKEHGPQNESQLAALSGTWKKAIVFLKSHDLLEETEQISIKPPIPASNIEPTLNDEQTVAIDQILAEQNTFKPWLLFGVTGSGKTEVYIQLLKQVLADKNAQALVLVPEINLTPQLEARFRNRLSEYPLVTLHSNLSESERLQNWLAAQSGEAKIVIGTRLSVFTPMPHLKLLIIDEEHDASYKQQDSMRYHARDVAMMRAKQHNVPIVMGTATPSLESWCNTEHADKNYALLTMKDRAVKNAVLPQIHCLDIAKSPVEDGLSPLLIKAIAKRLKQGEQSLIFINRRGYAPVLHCSSCQWSSPCTRCSAKLVVHLNHRKLRCHHCGHEERIPVQCPDCGNLELYPVGQATQRLTQTLTERFPDARIARVDRDSMRDKNALTALLTKVHDGEIDILIGTQMLAKGHDFANLTLVGVIDTDSALFSPDFRASERLFAQLMQVAGRAGRGDKPGEVLIQTAHPDHAMFHALKSQDYKTYANALVEERKSMSFPPLSFFAVIKAEAKYYDEVEAFIEQAMDFSQQIQHEVQIYGPVRPQIERLKGLERGHMLMQAQSRLQLQTLLRGLIPMIRDSKLANKIRWVLDIDPLEF